VSSQNNNNNDSYEGMELFEDDIRKAQEKRVREEEDSDNNEEPESKRQREDNSPAPNNDSNNNHPSNSPGPNNDSNDNDWEDYWFHSDDVPSPSSSSTSDSVSDNGEVSETERINTKYSKRFDAMEDYKEKNELLSEMSIKNVMNKLDEGETISKQEFETLKRANRLMDQDILKDKDSIERMKLYEDFSASVQREIHANNERIEHHEKKISEYHARLEELNQENSEMSSNNDSSGSDNDSDNNPDSNSPSNSPAPNDDSNNNHPSNSSGPNNDGNDDDDDDGFGDLPPSFDFDDF